ncbi:hypothetical protein SDC9_162787 [bioreactor metagenome]|uniref:Toxin CptA n=1 Tax=bioreactor metagenome TaxID=1076179 RepID=A0A645FTN9_9ZZZZ
MCQPAFLPICVALMRGVGCHHGHRADAMATAPPPLNFRPHLHAPALGFVLTRSRRLAGMLAVLSALQLMLLLGWWASAASYALPSDASMLKLLCALVAWLLASGCAWHWWHTSWQGGLRWDGLQWEWLPPEGRALLLTPPVVRLDLQSTLLVQTRLLGASSDSFLWMEQRADPLNWLALRRAVYSRAVGELSVR